MHSINLFLPFVILQRPYFAQTDITNETKSQTSFPCRSTSPSRFFRTIMPTFDDVVAFGGFAPGLDSECIEFRQQFVFFNMSSETWSQSSVIHGNTNYQFRSSMHVYDNLEVKCILPIARCLRKPTINKQKTAAPRRANSLRPRKESPFMSRA